MSTPNKAVTGEGNAPRVGQRVIIRGVLCEVIKVRSLGTIDVAALDPNDNHAFRVTGLNFIKP